jgi:hypothetical protein
MSYLSSPSRSIMYSERPNLAALASLPSLAYSASVKRERELERRLCGCGLCLVELIKQGADKA